VADVLIFKSDSDRVEWWRDEIVRRRPDLEFRAWPEVGPVDEVDYALVWDPEPGDLARYPNLRLIISLGAGVDNLIGDPALPRQVPICRIVDRYLTMRMTEYVVLHVLRHHRRQRAYDAQQRARTWRWLKEPAAAERRVGVMGLGVLGGDAADKLAGLGFDVAGWST